jgi:hypothetical protein
MPSRSGDALFVAVTALFTAAGVWMAVAAPEDRRAGIGVAAFFGSCLAVALWVAAAHHARRRSLAARSVEIVGSIPFRVRAGRGALLLTAVAAVMLVVAWAGIAPALTVIAVATALLCAALVPVVLFGPPSRRAVVFEPAGLRLVEASYDVRVPWDGIADARLLDVASTLVVALTLRDPAALEPVPRARRSPAAALRRLSRAMALNRLLYRCDLSIGPAAHGLDAILFLRAVETYAWDPASRSRLAPRALDAAR